MLNRKLIKGLLPSIIALTTILIIAIRTVYDSPTGLSFNPKITSKPWKLCPIHQGDERQQRIVCKAWLISKDMTFVYLLKAENGELTPNRKHNKPYYYKGKEYNDWGLCGISDLHWPKITSDPRFLNDDWQLEECYKLYKRGTPFYGMKNINKVKKFFTQIP